MTKEQLIAAVTAHYDELKALNKIIISMIMKATL